MVLLNETVRVISFYTWLHVEEKYSLNPAIDIGLPQYSWSQPFKRTHQCSGTITAYSSSLTGSSSISV